jgi:hypothetical protein
MPPTRAGNQHRQYTMAINVLRGLDRAAWVTGARRAAYDKGPVAKQGLGRAISGAAGRSSELDVSGDVARA